MAPPKYVQQGNRGIHVTGIPELTYALRQLDDKAYKELRKEFKEIADHVVGVAQQKMPWSSGDAARSIKPSGTTKGARIMFPKGGEDSRTDPVGYYPWLDFGGGAPFGRGVRSSTGASHERSASQIFRRRVERKGRYIYPAIAESTEYIEDAAYDALEKAARAADLAMRR